MWFGGVSDLAGTGMAQVWGRRFFFWEESQDTWGSQGTSGFGRCQGRTGGAHGGFWGSPHLLLQLLDPLQLPQALSHLARLTAGGPGGDVFGVGGEDRDLGDPLNPPHKTLTHLGACAAPGGGGSLPAGAGEGSLSRPGGSLGPHSKPGRPEGVLGGFPKGRKPPEEEKGRSEGGSPCAGGSRVLITNTPGCCTCRRGGHDPPSGGTCVFGGGQEVNPPVLTHTPNPPKWCPGLCPAPGCAEGPLHPRGSAPWAAPGGCGGGGAAWGGEWRG